MCLSELFLSLGCITPRPAKIKLIAMQCLNSSLCKYMSDFDRDNTKNRLPRDLLEVELPLRLLHSVAGVLLFPVVCLPGVDLRQIFR